tara:strand:+ start:685 stop:1200 length:516 start_codon:yes stop_codon:yes gene_type:complete
VSDNISQFVGKTFEFWEAITGNDDLLVGYPVGRILGTRTIEILNSSKSLTSKKISASEVKIPEPESYSHAELIVDENGKYVLQTLPYKPSPYPLKDMYDLVYLENKAENKIWAISKCGNYSFFSNENTKHLLVFSALSGVKTFQQRITEKLNKGYKENGVRDYHANKRSLR